MNKLKLSSLLFVSQSDRKYSEIRSLMRILDLRRSTIFVADPQSISLEFVVEEKIKAIIPQLPNAPFFVENTGLFIDAWKGLPGGFTRMFMDTVGNDGICKMMRAYKSHERIARAKTLIGYYSEGGGIQTFLGETVGTIAAEPRGTVGFGWDPIFQPDGDTRTFAEMSPDEKDHYSMRKEAVDKFMRYLGQYYEL